MGWEHVLETIQAQVAKGLQKQMVAVCCNPVKDIYGHI